VLPALRLAASTWCSKALTKLVAAASDGLVCHGHAALEEQFFNVAQAQLKAKIPARSATDDLGRETMTVIKRFRFLHHAILRDRPNDLTMSYWEIHGGVVPTEIAVTHRRH
jgi:hypothetical protein